MIDMDEKSKKPMEKSLGKKKPTDQTSHEKNGEKITSPEKKETINNLLLDCLVTLTHLYRKPFASQTLTAGLPLEKGQLTLPLFERAAKRAGLSAKITDYKLAKFDQSHLPTVLLLTENKSCLLVKIHKEKAQIIRPEIGEGIIDIDHKELESLYTGTCIFIQEEYVYDKRADKITSSETHWFWGTIKKVSKFYSEVLLAALLINLFAIAAPLFIMNVYDRVVPNRSIDTLWVLAIGMLIVIGFDFLMRLARNSFIEQAGRRIDLQLSSSTFAKIIGLRMAERPASAGAFTNTVQSFESLKELFTSSTMTLLVDMPFISIFLLVIFFLSPQLVFIPIIAIGLIVTVSLLIQKPLERLVNETYRHAGEKQAMLVESLVGAETIKILCAESARQSQWEKVSDRSSTMNIKLRSLINIGMTFSATVQYLSVVGLIITGVYLINAGNLTIGALIACTILNGRALASIVQISTVMIRYKQSKSSFEAINGIMKLPNDHVPGKSYLNRPAIEPSVQFKNVSFTYPGQNIPAIDDVSFKINAGEKVGIIGRAGSGKSTILKLLMDLYQPDQGQILMGNTDLTQIDPSQLRSQVGYLPQEIILFFGSILDNITMATPFAEEGAIIKASQITGLDSMINEHPDGFDRVVSERGSNLSGGQRQIIALTRTLLNNPTLCLFDEPSTALDNATIKRLTQRLKDSLQDKTLLLISHKISLLNLTDRIIVLERGKIVADDSREVIFNRLKNKK